ncbi:DUF4349 domain-containing protein [Streptomyces sp. MMG1121]|uniref:DUF4349 domain-containing protein n=1 Tax=Streptomyces sp. MMG1121 TaxID=1415544 RepID=UPI0006AF5314|nr:DUF4349 domain-containing protein [Streptomyces sp. MMG1121]KOV69242.1 hypothetical protein ADK64_05915 [Streptomyces sp. MMG1121]
MLHVPRAKYREVLAVPQDTGRLVQRGAKASLKDRTRLATITVPLSGQPVRKAAADGAPGIAEALSGGRHVSVTILRRIALALGAAPPFAAFAALVALAAAGADRGRTVPADAPPGTRARGGPGPGAGNGERGTGSGELDQNRNALAP